MKKSKTIKKVKKQVIIIDEEYEILVDTYIASLARIFFPHLLPKYGQECIKDRILNFYDKSI